MFSGVDMSWIVSRLVPIILRATCLSSVMFPTLLKGTYPLFLGSRRIRFLRCEMSNTVYHIIYSLSRVCNKKRPKGLISTTSAKQSIYPIGRERSLSAQLRLVVVGYLSGLKVFDALCSSSARWSCQPASVSASFASFLSVLSALVMLTMSMSWAACSAVNCSTLMVV